MVKLLNWKKGMPFKARGHSWLLELLLLVLELEKSCFSWSYKVKRTLDSCTFAHWAFSDGCTVPKRFATCRVWMESETSTCALHLCGLLG